MVRVRKTIFSVAGICDEGFFNNDLLLVETERAMMRAAAEVIVVADSTKFGHPEPHPPLPLGRRAAPGRRRRHYATQWREKVQAAGVDLIVAEPVSG